MSKNHTIQNFIITLFMVLMTLAFLLPPCCSYAESGSITIECRFTNRYGDHIFENAEYSLVKIADADIEQNAVCYRIKDEFREYDCDWNAMRSSDIQEKADELKRHVIDRKIQTDRKTADQNGMIIYSGLEPGLYLIYSEKIGESGYIDMPALASVPQVINNEISYDIHVDPKYRINDIEKTSAKEKKQTDTSSAVKKSHTTGTPQTGDILIVMIILLGLYSVYISGMLINERKKLGSKAEKK